MTRRSAVSSTSSGTSEPSLDVGLIIESSQVGRLPGARRARPCAGPLHSIKERRWPLAANNEGAEEYLPLAFLQESTGRAYLPRDEFRAMRTLDSAKLESNYIFRINSIVAGYRDPPAAS